MEAWSEYSRFLIALFAILTPFAAIPIFLGMTEGRTREQRNAIAQSAVLTVATVLVSSVFLGDAVLTVLGTSLASFRVGGGIVLLLIALSLLNATVSAVKHTVQEADEAGQRTAIGVVPLGLPLLAGPGSISAVIIEAQRGHGWEHFAILVGCILAVCAGLLATLRLAVPIGNKLGQTGLNIMNRLTGLLLAAVAVEIIAAGLRALFPGWMT
ncbi:MULTISPECIES: MarC family protein [Azospirillaceae]|uniref:MarC family protein n=1 Tax=Azospirillaceae TaxID=2829815 RepID=UPI000B6EB2B4|nr:MULTISPECIES: MarC family protein [Azospirillaceae]MDG5495776.1 MarC family protein [Niveispirillum sp. BGYR6]SNS59814.1 multiple antibiotic resistance protein [Azospirillum sp. RU38E]SNS79288.1 multiple antibiotic resistance protein [Azospirillum sp. RU37A]